MGAARWWAERRYGLLVTANVATVPGWAPVGQYGEWYRAHLDGSVPDVLLHPSPMVETLAHHRDRWAHIEHYDDFVPFLTFDAFDPAEWAATAIDAGMGYTVMVAKHHDGWCWWDAPGTDRTVLHDGPTRNVLGDYAAACERAGLAFGTYYSLLDWADARYPGRSYVDDVVHPQVLDLVERFGSRMLWGDGHWGGGGTHWRSDDLIAAARAIDPDIVVNDRWWSDGHGVASYEYRLPDDIVDGPWEMRRGLGASFGHNRAEPDDRLLDPAGIIALLTEVVAKGGHLLLAVGPDAAGRLPVRHVERLAAAGRWVRGHQRLVDRGEPWVRWGDADARYLVLDGGLHAIDVSGRGRFRDLRPSEIGVTAIELDGEPVGFEQGADGVRIDRPRPTGPATVYRVSGDPPPPAPIELFPASPPVPVSLAETLAGASRGEIVQLGEGTYVGPARVPDGVTVRGLGPDRTRIDGLEGPGVDVGAQARIEHCHVVGGGRRIAWLPRFAVRLSGRGACVLGCRIDGHVEVAADDVRVTSSTATGLVATAVGHLVVSRSTFRGMQWDCGIDVTGGSSHVIESCEFRDLLTAIRLTATVGATVRGNRIESRWWGVQLVDAEATTVSANAIERTMRAVDVDGGSLAEISGNAAHDGDSGCVVQRGAADVEVAGNHWERCRVGLVTWDAGPVRHHGNTAVDLADPEGALVTGP